MAKTTCTKNSRMTRGALGGTAGLLVGGAIGLGVAWWLASRGEGATPIWVARLGTPLAAAAAGVAVAAWNPECGAVSEAASDY
jgi:hypothetical protein